jgi:ubiquinone/menaquinone biosynthesis C-methylase UbiE
LDAGCGSNVSSLSRIPEKAYFVGVDVDPKNVSESKEKSKNQNYKNVSFIVASITDLPLRNDIFSIIICCDVLEHIKDKYSAISEIARVCKKGGEFIGSTSNFLNPIMMLDSLLPKKIANILASKFAGEHYERRLRLFPTELRQLITKKFQKCGIKLLGFPPFQPWIYEFSNKKLPWFAHIWTAIDKLTNIKPFNVFKETIIFLATK